MPIAVHLVSSIGGILLCLIIFTDWYQESVMNIDISAQQCFILSPLCCFTVVLHLTFVM